MNLYDGSSIPALHKSIVLLQEAVNRELTILHLKALEFLFVFTL